VYEADKELARVKLQGEGKLKQYEADVKTQESTVELNRAKLQRDQANLAGCKINAPQDGLVVYAMGNNRFSNESMIEEGATIRNRQEIIKLPDVAEMKLAIKIHESHINMIRQGLGAYVVLDSMPDQRFRGAVRKVSLLPDSSSRWGNPNLKSTRTEILLVDKTAARRKAGCLGARGNRCHEHGECSDGAAAGHHDQTGQTGGLRAERRRTQARARRCRIV
jgi:hypothetical protein